MFETAFIAALNSPTAPPPAGVSKDKKRFNVYKNNVTLSLKEGMKANFPCVLKLVGEGFFDFLSTTYLNEHPPKSRLMFKLGENFYSFLKTVKQAESLPFLSDIALLEQQMRLSYHAKDAEGLSLSAFKAIAQEQLGDIIFTLSPSFHLLKSETPFVSIYEDCMGLNLQENIIFELEYAFILREDFEVFAIKITSEQYTFLKNISDGQTLAKALEGAYDASSLLSFLMQSKITTGINYD